MSAKKPTAFCTMIGGQALMEGVMMKGPALAAAAVRRPDGTLDVRTQPLKRHAWQHIPLVRGVCAMVDNFLMGYRYLSLSADISMDGADDEPPSAFERWLQRHFGERGMQTLMALAALGGVVLAVVLFVALPTAAVGLLARWVPLGGFAPLLECVCKLGIFLGYLALVANMKEIRRVFAYHGAEHKTIRCYEAGQPLTVENVRGYSRFHPRCGTSFLLIVLLISLLAGQLLPFGAPLVRIGLKLLTLPVVVGVAYEIIKLAGRYDNPLTRAISAPGMWLQRLTTREPDDGMIEAAIAAMLPVLPADREESRW